MTVKQLKDLLVDAPDDMMVLIPSDAAEFNGVFLSPCIEETSICSLGIDENSDETEDSFVIVPCGFFEEKRGVPPELN